LVSCSFIQGFLLASFIQISFGVFHPGISFGVFHPGISFGVFHPGISFGVFHPGISFGIFVGILARIRSYLQGTEDIWCWRDCLNVFSLALILCFGHAFFRFARATHGDAQTSEPTLLKLRRGCRGSITDPTCPFRHFWFA